MPAGATAAEEDGVGAKKAEGIWEAVRQETAATARAVEGKETVAAD